MNYRSNEKIFRAANDKYNGNQTMLSVYDAQLQELDWNDRLIYQAFLNNFVKYCDIEGIRRFEAMFDIKADEVNDTMELRRARIINKFAFQLPYTKINVRQMLDNLFGAENVEFNIDYPNYRVDVGIETSIDELVMATLRDLRNIIPANMILETIIYMPYVHGYLRKHYTHRQMQEFTQRALSQYA